jgi:hypothetical protein
MICTPETLLNAAACFQCLSEKQLAAINSYLLCQILNTGGTGGGGSSFSGSGAPTTQVPTGTSGTYYDYTNNVNYQWNPVSNTWVLVGGGGSIQIYTNNYADPNVAGLVPDDPAKAAQYQQDTSITLYNVWVWSVISQSWYQTVAPS